MNIPREVSTHSHPKVAACVTCQEEIEHYGFNTQPPEGGCVSSPQMAVPVIPFQHTATRRWLLQNHMNRYKVSQFQHTATRRWLRFVSRFCLFSGLFQHTATRRWLLEVAVRSAQIIQVSTHSHPKVAASFVNMTKALLAVSTHSHPKVAA